MASEFDLASFIREIPDFPETGVLFRDITPLLHSPDAFHHTLDALVGYITSRSPDVVVAIESRGFIFGAPIADRLGLPFVPIRKPGKLPAARMSIEYTLEYGAGQLDIHSDGVEPGQRAVVVDDLLATGGTADAATRLIEMVGGSVVGLAFVVELASLEGRQRLAGRDIFTLLTLP